MSKRSLIHIKCLSHNDNDGAGEGILLGACREEIKSDCEYHGYETIDNAVAELITSEKYKKYDKIYITDISVRNQEVVDMIENLPEEEKAKFLLIDHHVPHSNWLKKYSWTIIEKELNGRLTCGTELFYYELLEFCKQNNLYNSLEILNKNITKDFVESIRLYDTWDWKEASEDVLLKYKPIEQNMLFYILDTSKYINSMKRKLREEDELGFSEVETYILDLEKEKMKKYFERKMKELFIRQFKIDTEDGRKLEYKIGICFAEEYISDLGSYIMTNNQYDIDFVMIVKPPTKCSLRTNKEHINVAEIAKHFGGGGHPQAAGLVLTSEILKNIVSLL